MVADDREPADWPYCLKLRFIRRVREMDDAPFEFDAGFVQGNENLMTERRGRMIVRSQRPLLTPQRKWGTQYFHNRATVVVLAFVSRVLNATGWDCACVRATAATCFTIVRAVIRQRLSADPNSNPTPSESRKSIRIRRAAAFFVLVMTALLGTGMRSVRAETVPLQREHGAFVLPVVINGRITRSFMIDSGASDVTISAEVLAALVRAGTIATTDFLESQVYQLADGSKTRTRRIRIRSLRVGGVELRDVIVSVAPHADLLLLGQSFLGRLQSWAIDNQRHLFAINEALTERPSAVPVAKHEAAAAVDDWTSIGQSKDGLQRLYVNRSSVRVKDGIRRAWFKTIFSPRTFKGVGQRNKWMSAITFRDAFDCEEATGRTEEATEYYDDDTKFALTAAELRAGWSSVRPGTRFNTEMGVTCKLAGARAPQRLVHSS